jgi:hypothetical protein
MPRECLRVGGKLAAAASAWLALAFVAAVVFAL